MRKIINIGGKEYSMSSSAYTMFKYKNDTGRKFMQDIQKIQELRDSTDNLLIVLDDFLDIILRITYVMIEEADPKQTGSFEAFLKETKKLFDDVNWVNEVIELAITPISGGNQGNPQ